MEIFQKIKIDSLFDPRISLLGIYPKELRVGSPKDICIPFSLQH